MDNALSNSRKTEVKRGVLCMLPLSIAVIPWGILAGSFAIEAGLSLLQAQAMSAILFAGSAQLVVCGLFKVGAGFGTILLTTFIITTRHFIYSVSMRQKICGLPLRWRVTLGFLLTDELYAVSSGARQKSFNSWFALGAGGSFYLIWNLASFLGIVAGSQFPALNEIGLEFAVVATFIALLVPQLTSKPALAASVVALSVSVLLTMMQFEGALICAAFSGMVMGYCCEKLTTKNVNQPINCSEESQ